MELTCIQRNRQCVKGGTSPSENIYGICLVATFAQRMLRTYTWAPNTCQFPALPGQGLPLVPEEFVSTRSVSWDRQHTLAQQPEVVLPFGALSLLLVVVHSLGVFLLVLPFSC